jgi:hypothetical protein
VINFKIQKDKSKQDLITKDAEYIKELLDDLNQGKLFLIPAEEFDLFNKILSDLNVFLGIDVDSENIDQILGFQKAQTLIGNILLQLHDGIIDIFNEEEDNIYVN